MKYSASLLLLLLLTSLSVAQSPTTSKQAPDRIVIEEVALNGATTLDSTILSEITSSLTEREANENADEVGERIRDTFQQRGYFSAEVSHVKIRPLDPLARPKPVRVEADVKEGVRYKLGDLQFGGYKAFDPEDLRASIPVKLGEYFDVSQVRAALGVLRQKYASAGYIDFIPIPYTTPLANRTITLSIQFREGLLYRMGSLPLDLIGKSDNADALQLAWKLKPGDPFDETHLSKFLSENSSLLPTGITEGLDSYFTRDCRDQTITVHVVLDQKSNHPHVPDKPCKVEKPPAKTEGQ